MPSSPSTTDLAADITCYRKHDVTAERGLIFILGQLVEIIRGFRGHEGGRQREAYRHRHRAPRPCRFSRGVSIYSPHYPSWGRDVPFVQLLRERLGEGYDVPVFVDCVNRYQAVAEQEKGEAGGVTNFIIIDALNEGLGSGIMTHGELVRGPRASPERSGT